MIREWARPSGMGNSLDWVKRACASMCCALWLGACVSHEPVAVGNVALQQLRCAPEDVYTVVNRTTPKVREWVVGCDFYYARVLCSEAGCQRAKPRPACVSDGECFVEDPVTVEWNLRRTALNDPAH